MKSVCNSKAKTYHFFSIPSYPPLISGELFIIKEGVPTKIYFTLYEEDFLYYQVRVLSIFHLKSNEKTITAL